MNTSQLATAIYARVSSDRQAREGTIASQIEDLHARARSDGVTPTAELAFVDDGYSGATLIRPALEKLRDTVAAGAIDRLYVHCPDRLARDFAHQILLIDEFSRAGVEVVFLNHSLDDSPEGELLLQIQGVIAQYERAKIRERSRRGRKHAARCGAVSVLAGAPYGYRYLSKADGDGRAEYVVMIEEARVVRQIFEWVALRGCSLGAVVRNLSQQGTPTRTGLPRWDRGTLAALLANPAYKGTAGFGKTQQSVERKNRLRPRLGQSEFPRHDKGVCKTPPEQWDLIPVPALIDEETFAAAQEQLAGNRARHGRPAVAGRYLLQGLVVCCCCGRAYCGKHYGGKKARSQRQSYSYYRCCGGDSYRFGGQRMCSNRAVRSDRLDAAVWEDVSALLLEPGRVDTEYRRRLENEARPADNDREALLARIKGVKRRIARLVEMYEDEFLDRQAFRSRMQSAKSRLTKLEAEAASLVEYETGESELRLVMGHLGTFAERMRSGLDESDWQTRQAIVRALVKRIEVGETEVRVVYKVSPAPFDPAPRKRGVLQYCRRRPRPRSGPSPIQRNTKGSASGCDAGMDWGGTFRVGSTKGMTQMTLMTQG